MIQKWVKGIEQLFFIVARFPNSAYAGRISCLSAEWQFICRIVLDIETRQVPVKTALRAKFLPMILSIHGPISNKLRTLLSNGVKTEGLAIWDPTPIAASLCATFKATNMLAGTLAHNELIHIDTHRCCVCTTEVAHQKPHCNRKVAFYTALWRDCPNESKKLMEWATAAGA
ncbi:hypothetical protein ACHAW6_003056 [Cyclotella cf. meneghiniana]